MKPTNFSLTLVISLDYSSESLRGLQGHGRQNVGIMLLYYGTTVLDSAGKGTTGILAVIFWVSLM